jgi:hypothetical protein
MCTTRVTCCDELHAARIRLLLFANIALFALEGVYGDEWGRVRALPG